MTHFPQPNANKRAARVQLGNSCSALILLDDGKRTPAKMLSISTTGGLLHMAKALSEGDFVEIAFQTQSGPIRGMAEMLVARKRATDGVSQAFRFIALGDDDHRKLRMEVDSVAERSFLSSSAKAWSARKLL